MDYSATDKHKTVIYRADANGVSTEANAARWADTAAITSLKVLYNTNMKTGMTLSLYGVIA
jgi:hypothetical protein